MLNGPEGKIGKIELFLLKAGLKIIPDQPTRPLANIKPVNTHLKLGFDSFPAYLHPKIYSP